MSPGTRYDYAVEFVNNAFRISTNSIYVYKSPCIVHTNKVFVRFTAIQMRLKKSFWLFNFLPRYMKELKELNAMYMYSGIVDKVVPVERLIFWNEANA